MAIKEVLPGLLPIAMKIAYASEYACMSEEQFLDGVRSGRLPKPRSVGDNVRRWSRKEIDEALGRVSTDWGWLPANEN